MEMVGVEPTSINEWKSLLYKLSLILCLGERGESDKPTFSEPDLFSEMNSQAELIPILISVRPSDLSGVKRLDVPLGGKFVKQRPLLALLLLSWHFQMPPLILRGRQSSSACRTICSLMSKPDIPFLNVQKVERTGYLLNER